MAIYHQDIADIELNSGSILRTFLKRSIGLADAAANRFGVRVFRDGEPETLSGVTCQGFFKNADGVNIALTSYGTIDGNVAYVTLPAACYNVEGRFTLAIKLVGSDVTGTMRIVDGNVDNTNTSSPVAPTGSVPTYQEVLSVFGQMQDALEDYDETVATQNAQISDVKGAFVPILDKLIKNPLKTYTKSLTFMQTDQLVDKDSIYYNTDSSSSSYKKLRYYDGTQWVVSDYTVDDLPYHYDLPETMRSLQTDSNVNFDIGQKIIKSFVKKTASETNGTPLIIKDAIGGFVPEGLPSNLHVCGKNIFPVADCEGIGYGVQYKCKNGVITINGTGSANGVIELAPCNYFLPNGLVYTMSCNQLQSAVYMLFDNRGITTGYSRTVTLTSDRQNATGTCGIKIESGKTYSNLEIKFQVEIGDVATDFEPYYAFMGKPTSVLSDTKTNYSFDYYVPSYFANVKEYGAKGDGSTDDTLAIQNAVTNNNEVYFPEGTYIINGTITIPSGRHLYGDGNKSKIKLGNSYTLATYEWRQSIGVTDYYFHPYFITEYGADSVIVDRLFIEGNTTEEDVDQIQTGLCFWHATNCIASNINIQKVNFHPESAPPRETVRQTWRRGWDISMFYSENITIRDSTFMYGAYECVRVGDFSKHVLVENCIIKYGWRTGLQCLKGTEYVTIRNCDIEQDSHEEDDNPWCTSCFMTFHAYADGPISHIKVMDCNLHGILWNSGGTNDTYSIHMVDAWNYDFLFENVTVYAPNSYCSMLAWGDKIQIKNCEFVSDNFGIKYTSQVLLYPSFFTEEEYGFVCDNNVIKTKGMGLIVINTGKIEILNNKITGGQNTAVMNQQVELAPSLIFIRTTQDSTHSGIIIQKSQICNNMCTFLGKRNGIHIYLDTNIKDSIICENVLIGANYPILAVLGTNIAVLNNICKSDHIIDVPDTNNLIANNLISS